MYKICFLFIFFVVCAAIDIENYLKICDRNSLEVNECLVEAVQKGIKDLAGGNADLGVPALDPFYQDELKMEYNNNQIQGKMLMSNIFVAGLSRSTVKDARLKADEDSFHLEIDMFTPKVKVYGEYEGGGSYNSLKLLANGNFSTTMTDLVYTWKLNGKPHVIKGITYIKIKSFYMRPDVGTMKTNITNENPDSKPLIDLGVKITNENWRLLYKEFLPFAQANWNKSGTRVANKIFLTIPYDTLFPNKS
ncbi:circadian clock-controlled protein daywake [Pieris napi]|uniref:circadian clock-controlled protein daywake n=1 Tax=Pieris napi TaxID=78633 RepID=UPI001FBB070E|nr:circadian clock-controlled protein daywake [Pieris napi]